MTNRRRIIIVCFLGIAILAPFSFKILPHSTTTPIAIVTPSSPLPLVTTLITPTPTPPPSLPPATPRPKGPCINLPVLTYHHVQPQTQALAKHQTSLTVYTPVFSQQMQYLKDKGYHSIRPIDLVNYFNQVSLLPSKPILITFDDGYEDFHTDAYPVLKQLSLYSVMFLPTGLIENPDYLNWNTLNFINSEGLVEFANHTWSHQQLKTDTQTIQKEITTAHSQLSERGLNQTKTFAYPYGAVSSQAILSLTKLRYQLGFTTKRGTFLCKDNQLTLPRIHIGNLPLSAYGL